MPVYTSKGKRYVLVYFCILFITSKLYTYLLDVINIYSLTMIVHTFLKQKWIQWNIGLTRQKYRTPNLNTTYEVQDQAVYQLSQDDLEYCTQTVRVHSQSTHRRADRVCEFGSRRLQSRRRPAGRRRCGHPMRLSTCGRDRAILGRLRCCCERCCD